MSNIAPAYPRAVAALLAGVVIFATLSAMRCSSITRPSSAVTWAVSPMTATFQPPSQR